MADRRFKTGSLGSQYKTPKVPVSVAPMVPMSKDLGKKVTKRKIVAKPTRPPLVSDPGMFSEGRKKVSADYLATQYPDILRNDPYVLSRQAEAGTSFYLAPFLRDEYGNDIGGQFSGGGNELSIRPGQAIGSLAHEVTHAEMWNSPTNIWYFLTNPAYRATKAANWMERGTVGGNFLKTTTFLSGMANNPQDPGGYANEIKANWAFQGESLAMGAGGEGAYNLPVDSLVSDKLFGGTFDPPKTYNNFARGNKWTIGR